MYLEQLLLERTSLQLLCVLLSHGKSYIKKENVKYLETFQKYAVDKKNSTWCATLALSAEISVL